MVANDKDVIKSVLEEINKIISKLNRKNILNESMKNSKFVIFKNDIDAVDFVNYYAPEHYMICVEKKQFYIDGLKNAGSVFIGNFHLRPLVIMLLEPITHYQQVDLQDNIVE